MIKVADSGEIEIYPKSSHSIMSNFAHLFILPIIIILAYLAYILGGGIAPLVVILVVGLATVAFLWWQKHNKPLCLNTGKYLVSHGKISQLIDTKIAHNFTHDGKNASITNENDQFQLKLKDANNKNTMVVFAGLENKREAEVMLATLQGKKVSVRKKKIKMQSKNV